MLSIPHVERMRQIYLKTVWFIFQSCIKHRELPTEWKKANIIIVHDKSNKQILKNYWPVSLLPICGKVFERLICNRLYEYFIENGLISSSQSGFKPGDFCINQLLYESFDNVFEIRSVFLDMSKAFNKVWHKGLVYKFKQNGVVGNKLSKR